MIQASLDFNPEPALNPSLRGTPERRLKALQRKCFLVLERLLAGPATNVELHELIRGTRNAAPRVNDLRPWLRRGAGRSAWDKASDPIPCRNDKSTGLAVYELAGWAVEAGRELLARRKASAA